MTSLSDDDLNLRDLTDEELALAWDLWFDLAQATNDEDPPYTHGVFQLFTQTRVDSARALSARVSTSKVTPGERLRQ